MNPVSPPPSSEILRKSTEAAVPLQEGPPDAIGVRTAAAGAEALSSIAAAPTSSDLGTRVSKNLPNRSVWQSIARFFSRHFSPVSAEESKQAKEIKKDISEVRRLFKQAENSLSTALTISDEATSEQFRRSALMHQARATLVLNTLVDKKDKAVELAERHASFDSLPGDIEILVKKFDLLAGRVAISEKLIHLKDEMIQYKSDPTWNNFNGILDQRKVIHNTMRDIIKENPVYKSDPLLQKYAEQESLSATDAHLLLNTLYPDLKKSVDRTFRDNHEIINTRVTTLNQKGDEIKSLLSGYQKVSKEIDRLENYLTDTSISARIYRAFHHRDIMEDRLIRLKSQKEGLFIVLQEKCKVDDREIEWLNSKSVDNPKFGVLASRIRELKDQVALIPKPNNNESESVLTIVEEVEQPETDVDSDQEVPKE